jgi:hypothetical protein
MVSSRLSAFSFGWLQQEQLFSSWRANPVTSGLCVLFLTQMSRSDVLEIDFSVGVSNRCVITSPVHSCSSLLGGKAEGRPRIDARQINRTLAAIEF